MFLITSTVPFSAYIMVGIAVDRYLCICHPLLQVFTVARVKLVISLLTIPAMTFGILTALSFGTYTYEDTTFVFDHNYSSAAAAATTMMNVSGEGGGVMAAHDVNGGDPVPFFRYPVDAGNGNGKRLDEVFSNSLFQNGGGASYDKDMITKDAFGAADPSPTKGSLLHDVLFTASRNLSLVGHPALTSGVAESRIGRKETGEQENAMYSGGQNAEFEMITPHVLRIKTLVYHDVCTINGVFFSTRFLEIYGKIHALNFIIAFIIVVVLYILIYKSIITRRADKEARRNKNYVYTPGRDARDEDGGMTEETDFTHKHFGGGGKTHPSPPNEKLRELASSATTVTTASPELISVPPDHQKSAVKDGDIVTSFEEVDNGKHSDEAQSPQSPGENGVVKDAEDESHLQSEERPLIPQRNPSLSNGALATPPRGDSGDAHTTNTATGPTPQDPKGRSSRKFQSHNPRASKEKHKRNAAGDKRDKRDRRDVGYKKVSASSSVKQKDGSSAANSIKRKRPCNKHQMYLANIKTALMLLVVTTVFMVAFLPSLLMANHILPLNLTIFYGYFIYHVANPFIYAFMNQNFRDDLKKIVAAACRRR